MIFLYFVLHFDIQVNQPILREHSKMERREGGSTNNNSEWDSMHQHLEHKLSGASSEVWCTLKNRAPSLQVNLTNITVLSEKKKKKLRRKKLHVTTTALTFCIFIFKSFLIIKLWLNHFLPQWLRSTNTLYSETDHRK